jgi:16S rRNA pseudouridine516 synthase
MKPRRVEQLLSRYGYCSRKETKYWIKAQRLSLADGTLVHSVSEKVDPLDLRIDQAPIDAPEGLFLMLHKPLGFICAHDAPAPENIYELLPDQWLRRTPQPMTVGRLDKDTSGLLLITDVGTIVHDWTSPRRRKPKVYQVQVDRPLEPSLIAKFSQGDLLLPGETKPCLPAELTIATEYQACLTLYEGRFHQVRRMFQHFGYQVTQLHRTQVGHLQLGDLPPGEYQLLPLAEAEPGQAS